METLAPLFVIVVAFLIMFNIIRHRSRGKAIRWMILLLLFVPLLFGTIKARVLDFLSADYSWWIYALSVLIALIALKMVVYLVKRRLAGKS